MYLFKNTYLYMPVYLAVVTGMRAGEILALQWRDIDFKEEVINVKHSLRQHQKGCLGPGINSRKLKAAKHIP
ncbi:MAG: tyrosine-type recombinase/integrase [Bacillota bacterium]